MISLVDDSDLCMDQFLRGRNGGLLASIADSTMMWTVHEEMQRAHEKVKTKDSTARLNEISKFYQLAVIQLDVCHKFVQQEMEDDHHRDLLDDLASIRDHLRGRLVESEAAIAEKDKELMEMAENELSLRKVLEAKEREVVLLRSRLESQKSPQWIEDVEELSNAVDRQTEDKTRDIGSGGGVGLEKMASDIDSFKETLDIAFGKMRDAMVISEIEPSDQQLMSTVERDVLVKSVKEFITDVNGSFEVERDRRLAVSEDLAKIEKERGCSELCNDVAGDKIEASIREDIEDISSVFLGDLRWNRGCTDDSKQLYYHGPSNDLPNIADDSENIENQVLELMSAFMRPINVKLTENSARLEDLMLQMDSVMELVASLRRKELLYRKAFVIRSQNLQKAENEVDLLGDQVDRLLDLLEWVYAKLCHYSPLLEQHFELLELLASIHRELKGVCLGVLPCSSRNDMLGTKQ